MRLDGKIAIVTGAAQGLGEATARMFAKEGAKVAILELPTEEELAQKVVADIKKGGGEACFIPVDVTNPDMVEKAFKATVDTYGKLDILVNNAGIVLFASVTNCPIDGWRKLIDVDLNGVFICSRYGIETMKKTGGGAIVNVGSCVAILPMNNNAPYCVAKAGVVHLTKQMALEYGPANIRVNCICPGFHVTRMLLEFEKPDPEGMRKFHENMHPLRKIGWPEDIAYGMVYLASDEAKYVTGQILTIDGGLTLVGPWTSTETSDFDDEWYTKSESSTQ